MTMPLPDELRNYLQAVRDANTRIVEQRRAQLEPNLQDGDVPWLATENEQLVLQIQGFEDALGGGSEAMALIGRITTPTPVTWHTWYDVIDAAEEMNKQIESVLGDDS